MRVLVNGVLERVRADILTLVSEIQAEMDGGQNSLSPDSGSQASNTESATEAGSKSPVRRVLEPMAWIATILGTALAILWRVFG